MFSVLPVWYSLTTVLREVFDYYFMTYFCLLSLNTVSGVS